MNWPKQAIRSPGLDPARAMLDEARKKSHAHLINWVEDFAQEFYSPKPFDLVIMTGNAIQAILDEDHLVSFFKKVKTYLADDGNLAFETRNPILDWSKVWNYQLDLQIDGIPVKECRRLLSRKGDLMDFELIYEFPTETLVSKSTIRFWSLDFLKKELHEAGFSQVQVIGDFERAKKSIKNSREFVFLCSH